MTGSHQLQGQTEGSRYYIFSIWTKVAWVLWRETKYVLSPSGYSCLQNQSLPVVQAAFNAPCHNRPVEPGRFVFHHYLSCRSISLLPKDGGSWRLTQNLVSLFKPDLQWKSNLTPGSHLNLGSVLCVSDRIFGRRCWTPLCSLLLNTLPIRARSVLSLKRQPEFVCLQ